MSECYRADGPGPAQILPHVRNIIELATAGDNAQRKIDYFLEALYVFLRPVAIDGHRVTDVREDKGIDQSGQKVWWDMMAHVGQADEDTIALFWRWRICESPR